MTSHKHGTYDLPGFWYDRLNPCANAEEWFPMLHAYGVGVLFHLGARELERTSTRVCKSAPNSTDIAAAQWEHTQREPIIHARARVGLPSSPNPGSLGPSAPSRRHAGVWRLRHRVPEDRCGDLVLPRAAVPRRVWHPNQNTVHCLTVCVSNVPM